MDKLKTILNPGHKDLDETLYDTGNTTTATNTTHPTTEPTVQPTMQPTTHATTAVPHEVGQAPATATATVRSNAAQSPAQPAKEHNILKQIFNPNHDKVDPAQYPAGDAPSGSPLKGIPADQKIHSEPKKEHGILRQIFNPHGVKADNASYGQTATVAVSGNSQQVAQDGGALDPSMSAHDQVNGGQASGAQTGIAAPHESHLGRNIALGAGAVGAGVAAHEHHQHHQSQIPPAQQAQPQSHVVGQHPQDSHLARDAGVSAGVIGAGVAAQEHRKHHHDAAASVHQHRQQHAITGQHPDGSNLGRDAALGTGTVGAGVAAHEHHKYNEQAALQHPVQNGPAVTSTLPDRTGATGTTNGQQNVGGHQHKCSCGHVHIPLDASETQAPEELPQVPASGGKFMSQSALENQSNPAQQGVAGGAVDSEADPESGIKRRDTGPASKTRGPHKSNILNILDPRVRPTFGAEN